MFTTNNYHLSKSVGFLRSKSFSGFLDSIASKIDPEKAFTLEHGSRNRVFTTIRTFWLFLYQILMGNLSLDIMVQIAKAWLLGTEEVSISSNTSAFSQARRRLPTEFLHAIDDQVREKFPSSGFFHGFHLKLVDGTGISVPDTPANRKAYPKHGKAGQYSGFPSFKLVGPFDYESGRNLEWAIDTITTSDSALFRLFWPLLSSNDLIVGDRHFCGFAYFAFLLNLGIQMMTRKHQMRKYQKTVKQIEKQDLIVRWEKPKCPPKWLNQYQRYFDEFLKMIAYPRCRNKKNRVEPRAKKRRPKNFQFLTGDRHLFMPIPHRSKYKKAALT